MELKLPPELVGPRDLIALEREIERLADNRLQARVASREGGTARQLNQPGPLLNALLQLNGLTAEEQTLAKVGAALASIKSSAPHVRLSLASEPSVEVLAKIVAWFRTQIDPTILLEVGVQPTIGAGTVLRTPKHQYDWSIRRLLSDKPKVWTEVINRG